MNWLTGSIRNKIMAMTTVSILLTLAILASVNYRTMVNTMDTRLIDSEMPAIVGNIVAEVDNKILRSAAGLSVVADDPFVQQWILDGEQEDTQPLLVERLKKNTSAFNSLGSNFISKGSSQSYEYNNGAFVVRPLGAEDGWFSDFERSGQQIGINIYNNHKLFGTAAYINARISHDGEFLGIFSANLDLKEFVSSIINSRIGTMGNNFMVDKAGVVRLHENIELLNSAKLKELPGFSQLAATVLSNDSYSFEYEDAERGRVVVICRYLPELNWYLVVEASVTELISGAKHSMLISVLGLSVVLLLVFLVLSGVVSNKITGALKKSMAFAGQIASGDLSATLDVKGNDEVAQLSRSLNEMVEHLNIYAGHAQEIANGNLMVEVHVRSAQDTFGCALKEMVENLRSIIGGVQTAADLIAAGSGQVSDGSQSLSQGTTESAASLEEINSSMNEIGGQTKRTAENAALASTMTNEARSEANNGNQQMESMVEAMAQINDAGQNISKIIKAIDEIAFQTNLLALNAAVEAARAGQHGKGFAVVAEEVRNLAARSAKAASETAELIEASVDKTANGMKIAQDTAESLAGIVSSITKVTDLVGEISDSSNDQAEGISQINQGLGQIDQVIQQTTASAEEGAATSEELSGQAEQLKQMLLRFKLSNNNNYAATPNIDRSNLLDCVDNDKW